MLDTQLLSCTLKITLFTDGVNEVKALMQLTVRLITEEMLFNSITVRLDEMTEEAFLSPLLTFFIEGLAAIIPCPKENIFVFSIQVIRHVRKIFHPFFFTFVFIVKV